MSAPPHLHAARVPADAVDRDRAMLLLHGIYGRGRNWASIAKAFTAMRPDWLAWLVDLRLHGQSPALTPPHTVASAAADIVRLVEPGAPLANGPALRSLLGHSFGGKVALSLVPALASTLETAWIVESTPETRAPEGSAWRMLEIVRGLPPRFASRADAVAALHEAGVAVGTANWMATNLRHTPEGFVWTIDLDAMEALLRDFFATDLWPVVERPPEGVHLHFVKGTASSTLSPSAVARIEAAARATGRVSLHHLEGGHWLHTDNPEGLLALLSDRLA
jgi:pimeloyl-ACP methyl ester carboxylesterase